jgi:hypothetical protein
MGQILHGTVRDSLSNLPIFGAVVLSANDSGRQLSRGLTNERGEFRLPSLPGTARLRILRIGYRARDVSVSASLIDSNSPLDVQMRAIPPLLDPVVATANRLCPRRSDQGAVAAMWQQARAGLIATIISREDNPAQVVILRYQRMTAGSGDDFADQRVAIDSGQWSTPFSAARSAGDFVARGFLDQFADGRRHFYGPDALVLLDEAFQSNYCLSFADANEAHRNQIGLRFAPATPKSGRVDIEGTLWVDTVAIL